MNTKTIVLHHSADYDGLFCREIARKFLPQDTEFIGWDFGDPPVKPTADFQQVIIMDLPCDQTLGLSADRLEGCTNLVWIDHHKSAIESHPATIPGYRIDGVAACRLAWQWFTIADGNAPRRGAEIGVPIRPAGVLPMIQDYKNREVEEPLAVRLAGEYDIWDHRGDGDVEFQFGLDAQEEIRWDVVLGCDNAELSRSATINPDCKLRGTTSGNPMVDSILGNIGYFDHFVGSTWSNDGRESLFLHHRTGDQTTTAVVKELVEHFRPAANLSLLQSKALYKAIIECMANVLQHAYPENYKEPHLVHQWWVLGSRNPETHEISFCFYDQGVGIPRTIRTRLKDRFPLIKPSDSALVVRAVVEGHSRTMLDSRGKGLPSLKTFIDDARDGQLAILTHKSKCIFGKGKDPTSEDLELPVGGTLIVWNLKT